MSIITNTIKTIDSDETSEVFNKYLPTEGHIFKNQLECAKKALIAFDSNFPRPNHLIVKGKTQAGKTGVLTCIIMLIRNYDLAKSMNLKDIYYITGDNTTTLTKQTEERVKSCFDGYEECKCHFLKNSELKKELSKPRTELEHALLFIDESHYGVKDNDNTLIKWMSHNGIDMHNNSSLVEKYIYIISNSATPYDEINSDNAVSKTIVELDTNDWDGNNGYVGFEQYETAHCIYPIDKPLNNSNVEDYCHAFINHLDFIKEKTDKKKCVLIRMSTKVYNKVKNILEDNFYVKTYFNSGNNIPYDSMTLDMEHHCNDYDKYLMIVVAGAYRMGISIPSYAKRNIGIIYDYSAGSAKQSVSTTEQGLFGRITGYWDEDNWKDISIYMNGKHSIALKDCYVEQKTSTPQNNKKRVFVPDSNGSVAGFYVPDSTFVSYPIDDVEDFKVDKYYNEKVAEFLCSIDERYKNMVAIPGRKNDSKKNKTHFNKPLFNNIDKQVVPILKDIENIDKPCYVTLLDIDEKRIEVLCGYIKKGYYVDSFDDKKKIIETLKTK